MPPLPKLKHAILAQTVVLGSESHVRFDALIEALFLEHRPITVSERALVETMAAARWRQMRTWSLQTTDFDIEIALQDPAAPARIRAAMAFRELANNGRSLDTAHRLETAYDRQFSRASRDLAILKANREDATILASAALLTVNSNAATSTWDADAEGERDPESGRAELENPEIETPVTEEPKTKEPLTKEEETEGEASEHDQPTLEATQAASQPNPSLPRESNSQPTSAPKKLILPNDPVPISEHPAPS